MHSSGQAIAGQVRARTCHAASPVSAASAAARTMVSRRGCSGALLPANLVKIAITGVAGFIGSNLAERLLARGDEVRGLDDLSHGSLENLAGVLDHPAFRLHRGTILEAAHLAEIARGAEVLIHLAAGKIPRYGDALDTLVTNGEGGLEVLRAC